MTETLATLSRRIRSTTDLQSVVKTMKTLAAVNIRQYERAVVALEQYNHVIEAGLQIVLRNRRLQQPVNNREPASLGTIIFGSEQGLVGQFNERVALFAAERMARQRVARESCGVLAVGMRVAAALESVGQPVDHVFAVPASLGGIVPLVQTLVLRIEAWRRDRGIERVQLFYNQTRTAASYAPTRVQLLPIDWQWLGELQRRRWPTNQLPTTTLDWDVVFSGLIRQYLLVALFRACAASLAAENASRLASMQAAEHNIEEHLDMLRLRYHQRRQDTITEELMDIISGFEAFAAEEPACQSSFKTPALSNLPV